MSVGKGIFMLREITKDEYIKGIINNVGEDEKDTRQSAKSPYFLLNYRGMYIGLCKKFGFTKVKGKFIEKAHKELYNVYYKYVSDQLDKAETLGYVTLAFGLRLRTPMIHKGIKGGVPQYKIEQERRSAGNALFQSYGLLTIRAFSSFMRRVWNHVYYYDKVFAVVTIYDSIYVDLPNDLECLKWVNDNLIDCMKDISGCPELEHPIVKLNSDLELYYPSWADSTKIPNNSSEEEIAILLKDL
jgi:DNA polymerase-1